MNFYVLDENSEELGPFTAPELHEKGLQPKAQVRTELMSDWVDADSVDALKFIFDSSASYSEIEGEQIDETADTAQETAEKIEEETTEEALPAVIEKKEQQQGQQQQGQQQQGQQGQARNQPVFTTLPVYDDQFDINRLTDDEKKHFSKNRFTDEMSVGVCILLHFITCGIFTFIYCGLKYDNLPKVKSDDFGAGQAIGFMFIPFFNFYWQFVFWRTLVSRINFQFRLRGQKGPISMELATAFCIINLIPYVNLFVNFFILSPILLSQIQSASIDLAKHNTFDRTN